MCGLGRDVSRVSPPIPKKAVSPPDPGPDMFGYRPSRSDGISPHGPHRLPPFAFRSELMSISPAASRHGFSPLYRRLLHSTSPPSHADGDASPDAKKGPSGKSFNRNTDYIGGEMGIRGLLLGGGGRLFEGGGLL